MKQANDKLATEDKEVFLGFLEELDQQGKNLLALMLFAIGRRDPDFCDALIELRNISGDVAKRGTAINKVDDALLVRLGQICPGDERVWWERSLDFAKRSDDGVMHEGLVELMQRRVAG